jgi:hypothetical protein
MAYAAAYSGLRWGELAALCVGKVDHAARVITVDRKVVEVAGHLYVEAPKNRKYRSTIYPRRAPGGYPLAEQEAGANPLGLVFPSPGGSTGGRPTSAATSSSPTTSPPAGAPRRSMRFMADVTNRG